MKSLKIPDDLHFELKRYSIFKKIKLEQFVENELRNSKGLVKFNKNVDRIKFH